VERARSTILIVALWHLALNLGSATKAGEGIPSVVVTMFVIVWSIAITRAWRRRDESPAGPMAPNVWDLQPDASGPHRPSMERSAGGGHA
jgi:hypothetical protein